MGPRVIASAMAVIVVNFAPGPLVNAQRVVMIRDSATCDNCIRLEPAVTLIGNDSTTLSRSSKAVAIDEWYVVAPTYTPGQVVIYATDGTFVATFGRRGQGPGEFAAESTLRIAPGPGDSITIVDRARWHVFSPERQFMRTTILPAAPLFAAVTPNGMLLGSFPWQASDGRVHTVSMMNSSGRIVRSYDPPSAEEPGDPWTTLRIVQSYEGALWTARVNRVEIRREPLGGDSVPRIWRRTTGWFPGWQGYNGREPYFERPRPQMTGFGPTADVIWVFSQTADRHWQSLRNPGARAGVEAAQPPNVDPEAFFDGVIEAVDRLTGRVLARLGTDEVWRPVPGRPDMAQHVRTEQSGELALDLVSLVLIGK